MAHYPSLKDRVVIVTGGGRGLGRVMVWALLQQGAKVMITGARSQSDLDETVAAAQVFAPGACRGRLADVSDPAACESVAAATVQAFGRVDCLINNAGRPAFEAAPVPGRSYPFWEADVDGYQRLIATNFIGPYLMARAVVPGMLAQGFGRVLNISTSRRTMALKGGAPYGAAKAGLEACTVVWAMELEGTGVTANVLLPGGASDTALIWGDNIGGRSAPDFQPGKGPMGLEGDTSTGLLPPDIMGPPAAWLCSDESAAFNGRRLVARDWDDDLPGGEAAARAATEPHYPPVVM